MTLGTKHNKDRRRKKSQKKGGEGEFALPLKFQEYFNLNPKFKNWQYTLLMFQKFLLGIKF
jgi:hypothetical protein